VEHSCGLESNHSIAGAEIGPMPFLIVDNPFVVELRCTKSQLVVGIRGGHDKTVCLQERFQQLVRGSLSKFKFSRAVGKSRTELLEGTVDSKFFEVSITHYGTRQKSSLRYTRPGGDVAIQIAPMCLSAFPCPITTISHPSDVNCFSKIHA